jgi:hypothetical protein
MLRYLLIAMCTTLTLSQPALAQEHQAEMRDNQCRYQWVDEGTWTPDEEWRTARCVAARWSIPSETLDRIISCESGWDRLSVNPMGPYVGLAQHMLSAWFQRFRVYAPPLWHLTPSWKNSRTMLTVTVRMMHDVGLSPWGCA